MAHDILTEIRGGAMIVTFNRPLHSNALNCWTWPTSF